MTGARAGAAHSPTHAATQDREPAGAPSWHCWQLHLGSQARSLHDRVVTEVVVPTVRELPGHRWFFLRYWQGGPHVRLRVADLGHEQHERAAELLAERLRDTGTLREDERPLDPAEYERDSALMAAGEDATSEPLLAPGVHPGSYDRESERYGGTSLMDDTERLFQLSSELVAGLLPQLGEDSRRAAVAAHATTSAALALGDGTDARAFLSHGYEAWSGLLRAGYGLEPPARPADGAGEEFPDPGRPGPFSSWHERLRALAGRLDTPSSMHPGRVVFSHVHMLHNRLGLGLVEELKTYARLLHRHGEDDTTLDPQTRSGRRAPSGHRHTEESHDADEQE